MPSLLANPFYAKAQPKGIDHIHAQLEAAQHKSRGDGLLDKLREDPANIMTLAGMPPDPWQAEVLRCKDRQVMMLCSRQTGKTQTAAALALSTALLTPRADVLIACRALRQSTEMLRKVSDLRARLRCQAAYGDSSLNGTLRKLKGWKPEHLKVEDITANDPLEAVSDAALSMELTNGSRIIALPGSVSGSADTLLGYSAVAMLILDEGSRIRDEFYMSLRPVLAASKAKHGPDSGRLVTLSTPYGKRGWFYRVHERWEKSGKVWDGFKRGKTPRELAATTQLEIDEVNQIIKAGGSPGWRVFKNTYKDCPRIDADFIDEERASLGPRWFRQEYEVSFEETTDAVFASADIDALLNPAVTPWEL